MSVGQVCVDVDLLLDPGGEVRDVAVNPGSEHFTEAHAAPRRQAEQRPATAALLTHQWAAAVTLNTHTLNTHTLRNCVASVLHAGLVQMLPCRSRRFQLHSRHKAFWE